MTPNPVTIRADIAEGLAQEGMRATVHFAMVPRRIEKVHDGLIHMRGLPYAPAMVELDLLDPLTLCAITAWVASRLLGEEGQVFGPDEVLARLWRSDSGHFLSLSTRHFETDIIGSHNPRQFDRPLVAVGIFDHIPASATSTRHGRALALKAAVEAIAAGTLHR